jgi:hypothetical protein
MSYLLLYLSLLTLFFAAGGLFVTLLEDSVQTPVKTLAVLGTVACVALLLMVISGRSLLAGHGRETGSAAGNEQRKRVAFSLVLFGALVTVTLVLMNVTASFFAVPWPMNGLHGVSSAVGRQAWEYQTKAEGYAKVNSWGQ